MENTVYGFFHPAEAADAEPLLEMIQESINTGLPLHFTISYDMDGPEGASRFHLFVDKEPVNRVLMAGKATTGAVAEKG